MQKTKLRDQYNKIVNPGSFHWHFALFNKTKRLQNFQILKKSFISYNRASNSFFEKFEAQRI